MASSPPPRRLRRVEPGINTKTEDVQPYYPYVAKFCERHFGAAPSRTTLGKWLVGGYPIDRGGPYVRVPIFRQLKRPYTTVQAMRRFLTLVRSIEKTRDRRSRS